MFPWMMFSHVKMLLLHKSSNLNNTRKYKNSHNTDYNCFSKSWQHKENQTTITQILKPTEVSKARYDWHVVKGSIYTKRGTIQGKSLVKDFLLKANGHWVEIV